MNTEKRILVADSGSTKTNWCYFTDGKQIQFTTYGANPFFRNTPDLVKEWSASPVNDMRGQMTHVFFYAAGVINEEKALVIRKALQVFFPEAEAIVQSDLLAAAHATLGTQSGIACILGTGSNSCLYNGKEITDHVPPLGFILGDEGSGAVLGRQLVGDFLKKAMPEDLRQVFKNKFPLEYSELMNRVYRSEKPNMFLAGFVPFLKEHISHEYCVSLVQTAFDLFIARNVFQYKNYKVQTISFAGSVAYHFQEQLISVFIKRNLTLGKIIKEPVTDLLKYHLKQN